MNRTVPLEVIPAFTRRAAAVHALSLPVSGHAPGVAGVAAPVQ
ncbi:MAG: hypothetical protein ACKOWF_01830 [Chloroflexota bacterium]